MKVLGKIRLGDVCVTNADSYSLKEDWKFVNYLDTGNITDNKVDSIQYIDVRTDKLPSRARRKVKRDSIVYSTVRPNQRHFGIIKAQPDNFLVSTGFAVIDVVDAKVIDADFLYYLLTQPSLVEALHAVAEQSTSAYPSIKPSDLENLEIDIPPLITQKKIVDILQCLDKKITQNMAINQNLEEQARLVFQSWFVDFEPFGGSVPSDWVSSSLGKIASIKSESWSPLRSLENIVEYYSIPAFDDQRYPVFEPASNIKSNKYILTRESVLISKLNPDTKRIWRPLCLSTTPVCSTEFIVYEAKKKGQRDYIYSIIDSIPFFNHLCSHKTGSTNSRQRATPKSTLEFPIALPPDSIIEDFCQIVTPMYDIIASNVRENQTLTNIRDSLLPKLMTGELNVE